MSYKSLLLILTASVFFILGFAPKAKSQDAHVDSVISKVKIGSKIYKNIQSQFIQTDDIDTDNSNSDDKNEYGIGNVLGKSKKTGKVYKKSGKSVKVKIQITSEKVLVYEIRFDKANFGISKGVLDE